MRCRANGIIVFIPKYGLEVPIFLNKVIPVLSLLISQSESEDWLIIRQSEGRIIRQSRTRKGSSIPKYGLEVPIVLNKGGETWALSEDGMTVSGPTGNIRVLDHLK
ncbi:hypothetical protein T484DRAFT_3645885, partial [Baffinella frigidus]